MTTDVIQIGPFAARRKTMMSRVVWALGVVALLGAGASHAVAKDLPGEVVALLAQNDHSAVIGPLSEFLKKNKKHLEGWTALANAYYETDQNAEAREAFEKALKIKKKHWPAVQGYVRTLTRLHMFEEADKRIRKALKDNKKNNQLLGMFHHELGLTQLAWGMVDTANLDLALLDDAETNFYVAGVECPDSCVFRLDRGEIQFARRLYPMAISAYQEALDCDPGLSGSVNYRIARASLYSGDLRSAIGAYKKSAETLPGAKVYSELGDAQILYSRTLESTDTAGIFQLFNDAIASYTLAKKYTTDGCKLFTKVGKAEALMGMLEDAVTDFQAAIECGSEDPNVFFALGNVLIDLARFQEALDWYGRYRDLREPTLAEHPWGTPDADFFANYAMVIRIMADSADEGSAKDSLYDEAIVNYRAAYDFDSSRADILDDLGIAIYQKGRYEEAIVVFNRKIEMEPEQTNGYLNLLYCYLKLENWREVLSICDTLLSLEACHSQALEIGGYVAGFELKSGREARKWYGKALACDPTNCEAKMYIGYSYLVTNDTTQIKKCIPVLKEAYECRLGKGETRCGDSMKQNALWMAEASWALRDLSGTAKWAKKVLSCDPGHERASELRVMAEDEY